MKTTRWGMSFIILILLTTHTFAQQTKIKGEQTKKQLIDLTLKENLVQKEGFVMENGKLVSRGTPETRRSVLLKPLRVKLKNVRPFLAAYTIWKGDALDHESQELFYRTSVDKHQWSEWKQADFDGHDEQTSERTVSKMLFLGRETKYIQYRLNFLLEIPGSASLETVETVFYSPGDTPDNLYKRIADSANLKMADCNKPPVVSRSEWGAIYRASASTSNVSHLIVHHEFGSNSSSDWAARVRSVQNFHINGNGWYDIGYNFLVDPNGVIYEGRAGGDNAVGAHFCGKNRYTMAVCMLGDYSTISPTNSAQNSLKEILAWKSDKEDINPLGASYHYSVGGALNHIAGHRDAGCSACPGNGMYNILGTIRSGVSDLVANGCTGGGGSDTEAPVTAMIPVGGNVHAGDFQVNFTDTDNVGVTRKYFQVLEKYGSEWRANRNKGFFNDNFNNFYSVYAVGAGSWSIEQAHMKQSNTTSDNTRLSAYVVQNTGLPYLYEFSAKLVSTSGPKKFGIHIMADDPVASQRGNSYLIWFSGAESMIRVYETINNQLFSRAAEDLVMDNNWANYKITYSPAYGVIQVFRNNELVLYWTDDSPIPDGSTISLRTNQTSMLFDDLKVYKYRLTDNLTVTAGSASTDDCRTSSVDGTSPSCKVKSLVRDAAGNWSLPGNLDIVLNLGQSARLSNDLLLFPNEVDNQAKLQVTMDPGVITVSIIDMQGKTVKDKFEEVQLNETQLVDISHLIKDLNTGVYLVKVQKGKQEKLTRLIKN